MPTPRATSSGTQGTPQTGILPAPNVRRRRVATSALTPGVAATNDGAANREGTAPGPGPAREDTAIDAPGRRRLPVLLRRAWFGLNQVFRRRIAHLELTPDQFTVMRNVVESGSVGLTQQQLAERMGSDPNTIAAILERMEAGGLLGRRTDGRDRRANLIRLKAAGRRRYAAAREVAVALQAEVLSVVDPLRRDAFLEELERVAATCREAGGLGPARRRRSPTGA